MHVSLYPFISLSLYPFIPFSLSPLNTRFFYIPFAVRRKQQKVYVSLLAFFQQQGSIFSRYKGYAVSFGIRVKVKVKVQGTKSRVQGTGYRIQGTGYSVLGYRVKNKRYKKKIGYQNQKIQKKRTELVKQFIFFF